MSRKDNLPPNEKTDILKPSIYIDVIREIDLSDAPFKRILTYLSKVENPRYFQMEGYHVELEWMETDITLQERMKDIFTTG